MAEAPLIYLVAAERSGDLLGAGLIRSLRQSCDGKVRFRGMGGQAMAEEGVETTVSIDGLSILGFFDGVRALGRIKERVAEVAADIAEHRPAAVVLIDSWGFMLRVALAVREIDPAIKLIKYVGPQVFATRPGRAKTLAGAVDHLMTILSFDARYYEPHGLPVTFVGNPTLDREMSGDGAGFRRAHDIGEADEVLLVLLGSRPSEIKRLFNVFQKTLQKLLARRPGLKPVFVIADPVREQVDGRLDRDPDLAVHVRVYEDGKADAFAAATLALACSGTVVTELSTAGIPAVTGYRLGWLTWAVIRAFNVMKAPFISLVNIAAGKMLVPEFVQTRCRSDLLFPALEALLDDPDARTAISVEQRDVTAQMRGEGAASDRAADTVRSIAGF